MNQLHIKLTYQLELTPKEFSLINKALRGNLKDDEVNLASELSDTLMKSKVSQMEHYMREVNKLRENLESE
jgi:hypothetical protein